MKIKFVGQAMTQITVYNTNLLTLLCFTYKMMMIYIYFIYNNSIFTWFFKKNTKIFSSFLDIFDIVFFITAFYQGWNVDISSMKAKPYKGGFYTISGPSCSNAD